MKKLTKKSLEELAKVMPVLSEMEMRSHVGGDHYYFSSEGKLIRQVSSIENVFHAGGETLDISGTFSVKQSSGLMIEGSNIGRDVFEFLADNTSVEWGYSSKNDSQEGYLYSSHERHHLTPTDIDLYKEGYDNFYHSHGEGISKNDSGLVDVYGHPSDQDIKSIADGRAKGYSNFYIYNEARKGNNSYRQYDEHSRSMEEYADELGYTIKYE